MIAIPSITEDPGGRAEIIGFVEEFCTQLPGVHIARHESDGKPSLVASFLTIRVIG
jgi:hypothetical protein